MNVYVNVSTMVCLSHALSMCSVIQYKASSVTKNAFRLVRAGSMLSSASTSLQIILIAQMVEQQTFASTSALYGCDSLSIKNCIICLDRVPLLAPLAACHSHMLQLLIVLVSDQISRPNNDN